ncbi:CRISPR-associated protein Cas2 [Actinopolymorpha cephalotaxi]|uniref:CRISPR-associated protein Cas2 n=1 Tax=Actinopolymorpha cephalotaxi TaxID=504797 RepID=A0A1I3CF53_9ACTN|nr:type I-E CRISPR-associated endoribonuclease Cas2e [Actinopolymorpha cephalotaxi]NYH82085.1 CRISPR-associated protein Cas2 [Actinopolymorpha cephalotaxi]SFH73160.1 CRISPR-associated protein Cas2 [Actinopolymorpha cephalotaxi]
MTVIVLTACPAGLRGHLTRWLLEISAGVFVGNVTSRVRDLMWARVIELSGQGRALMVYSTDGEQRLQFKVHEHHWKPVDYDGVMLIRRPPSHDLASPSSGRTGWSKAVKRKRFGKQAARRTSTPPSPGKGP